MGDASFSTLEQASRTLKSASKKVSNVSLQVRLSSRVIPILTVLFSLFLFIAYALPSGHEQLATELGLVQTGDQPLTFDEVPVVEPTDLEVLARAAQAPVEDIRALNPELRRWCSPPATKDRPYMLRVPKGSVDVFLANLSKLSPHEKLTYRIHRDQLEIVVQDQGPGFDRTQLPHAAVPDDPFTHLDVREKLGLRAGGFGLLICQGMVDEMRYNDAGNEVTLIKRFPAA